MTKRVQILRHTAASSSTFTGLEGELAYDITNKKLRLHDGATAGGTPLAREDLNNVADATVSVAGKMSATDKQKLDGIESGATADQTAAEIKTAYESNADTNAFDDAAVSALSTVVAAEAAHEADTGNPHSVTPAQIGVASGAEVNPPPATYAELIAGTETAERVITPDQMYLAIQAIAGYVGDLKVGFYDPTSLPTGWILMYDSSTGVSISIGDASSGADYADDEMETLFTRVYNRCADAQAAVSTGRGANAAADWAAHKTLTLPNPSARAIMGSNPASHDSLSARVPGLVTGAETHTLTISEMPAHTHNFNGAGSWGDDNSTNNQSIGGTDIRQVLQSGTASHTIMQPSFAADVIIKYK